MSNEIQFLLYNMPAAEGSMQVVIRDETLWCTQKAMAQLFGVGVPAVSKHLKNIFEEGELSQDTTISKMETVVNRGIRGEVKELIDFYSLDAIIAVGYRVSSLKATRSRQWMRWFRTVSIMQSPGTRLRKSSTASLTTPKRIWD